MLFSRKDIAELINERFEPVWQSVRPVPTVRIDFGNGEVITRTLHGNIATYVCAADGQVLDILPGIYEAAVYQEELSRLAQLFDSLRDLPAPSRQALLARYHSSAASARPDGSQTSRSDETVQRNRYRLRFEMLGMDTSVNQDVRRRQVHERLAAAGPITPEAMTRWLYRQVLHTDLDDPYLGIRLPE